MSLLKRALANKTAPASPTQGLTTAPEAVVTRANPPSTAGNQEVRLAVCVPCRDMMHSVFSHNLHSLINYNWQKGIETKVFYNMSTLLQAQRENLVSAARSWAATHILWLDSDMSFPFYTAYKLLDHDQPIVAGNYVTRQMPYKTVAYTEIGGNWDQFLKHGKDTPINKELIEVEAMGMGCMLTDITVFDKLQHPYFPVTWSPESQDYLGEDINFCTAARAAGYKIQVDDILSRQLTHIGAFAFGHDLVQT